MPQSIIAMASGHSDTLDDKKNDYAGEESKTRTSAQHHHAQVCPHDDHHLPSIYNTVRRKIFATEKFRDSLSKGGAEIFATKIFAKAALIHCVIL